MSQRAQQDLDMTFKIANLALKGMDTLEDAIYQFLNYLDKNPDAKILKKQIKDGGDLSVEICDNKFTGAFSRRLENEGIPHVTGKMSGKNGEIYGVIIIGDQDRRRAKEIRNELLANVAHKGIIDKELVYSQANGNIKIIPEVSLEEAMLFTEHAEEKGLQIAIENPKQNKYNIIFGEPDREKIDNIKRTVAIELSGEAGEALKKQLRYENDNSVRIMDAILNNENPYYHIVDLNGDHVFIKPEGISIESDDNRQFISRKDPSFEDKVQKAITDMKNPVDLTGEEYDKYTDAASREEKKSVLLEADHDHGRPEYTRSEMEAIAKMERSRSLYEQKLMRENPDQIIYQYSYTNDEMRMADFEEYEKINSEAVHDRAEGMSYPDPEFYDDAAAKYRGYNEKEQYFDMEEEEYQNAILDGDEDIMKDYEHDMKDFAYDDMMTRANNDNNFNGIIDDYERE